MNLFYETVALVSRYRNSVELLDPKAILVTDCVRDCPRKIPNFPKDFMKQIPLEVPRSRLRSGHFEAPSGRVRP